MKKITIKSEQAQPLIIYIADNVFAHMRPAPTKEQQTQLLEYIAVMLAKTGKTETHYLQYAYFNPAGNNQLSLYFARESKPKDVVQAKPDFKPESVAREEFSILIEDAAEQEARKANERFIGLQAFVKEAIKGEHNPPFRKENELHQYINQDSKQRRKEAAAKLYRRLHKEEQHAEEKAAQFSVFVTTPEAPFSHEISEFTQRKEITEMGEFIVRLSKKSDGESVDVTKYRKTLAENLQEKLNAVQEATTSVMNDAARQLDLHEKRSGLQDDIEFYSTSRDDRARIMSMLANAVYNAAKDYYLSIWENDKYALDAKIPAFNAIFGKLIQIDPNNLSLTSIDDVFATLMQSKMKAADIEKTMTDMLNAAYGKIGSPEWQNSRDAIEFLLQNINKIDPEHTCLPKIERIKFELKMIFHPNHQFRFSDGARKQLEAFDAANQKLLAVKKDDADEIHFAGTSLVDVAQKVKEKAQSKFNNLSELTSLLEISRVNLDKFSAIVAEKDSVSNKLTAIQAECPNPDDIQSPAADPALGNLSPVITQLLNEQINGERAALQETVHAFGANIQARQAELDAIMVHAHESAMTLTPLSSNEFEAAFSAANDRALSLKTDLTEIQQHAEFAQMRIQIHKKDAYDILQCQLLVNALYNLEYWKTTTGTFGIQAKVTLNGQSSVVPREIGGMLNRVKDIENEGWNNNPDTARALIANLQQYAAQHPTSNQSVNRLYDAIRGTQPANNNTPLNSISGKIQNMAPLLPQPLARITDDQTNATEVAPSHFWQRHPVLKKALIGALIGTIIPVVGTIIGLIVGTVIGKRDEKRAQQPQRERAEVRRESTNPFDSSAQEEQQPLLGSDARTNNANSSREIKGTLAKKYEGNPFVDAVQSDEEVDYSELDKLMEDIDKINPDEVVARLSKPNPSFFDAKTAAQEKRAVENDFVSNLLQAVFELKAPMTSDKSLPTLKSDMESLQKKNWNPKEKSQTTRDKNLLNLIEILQISYRTSCTDAFITSVLKKTAEQHSQLDVRMFENSPLNKFGIHDIVSGMQKNRLM